MKLEAQLAKFKGEKNNCQGDNSSEEIVKKFEASEKRFIDIETQLKELNKIKDWHENNQKLIEEETKSKIENENIDGVKTIEGLK